MINTNKILETTMNELANINLEEYQWHEIQACLHQLLSKCEYANEIEKINNKLIIKEKYMKGKIDNEKKKNNINTNGRNPVQ